MRQFTYFLIVVLILIGASCTKDYPSGQKSKMQDLTVHPDFRWNTTTTIEVSIEGIPADRDFFATLYLKDDQGAVLLKRNHSMRQNLAQPLTVASNLKSVTLEFGHRMMTSEVVDGKVTFSFIQKDDVNDYSDN